MTHSSTPHPARTLWWEENAQGGTLFLLDQTLLPQQVHYLQLSHERDVAEAIHALRVRGAPAIGVAAAFGMVVALSRLLREQPEGLSLSDAQRHLDAAGDLLYHTRPTAVNLGWAVKRMLHCAAEHIEYVTSPRELLQILSDEARTIEREDQEACLRMGEFGAELIADGDTILTHCNAGALAATGIGTALAPIYVAHEAGKKLHILVDETRPLLQGARLTAWELQNAGVPLTLITDNMAGSFMHQGHINAIFVGADRIAANGDTANKIGTYSVAVLAHVHNIPVYVVAPTSTVDLSLPSGDHIPVEQRNPTEVTSIRGNVIAPSGVFVANPAFDVTPHRYITAIITEKGVARAPYEASLRTIMEKPLADQASADHV